jgi:hypothetical protein
VSRNNVDEDITNRVCNVLDKLGPDGFTLDEKTKKYLMRTVEGHYCPDWDYLFITLTDTEIHYCHCNEKK